MLGSIAVVLIPFFGIGLLALVGFMARTIRNGLEGREHPLADWDDLGGILMDGLRVVGVGLVWLVAAFAAGGLVFAMAAAAGGIAGAMHSEVGGVIAALGAVVAFGFLIVLILLGHVLFPVALIRMMAADRFSEALRLDAILGLVGNKLRFSIYLLLTILLVEILGDLTILFCLVGIIPGTFWAFATYGVAMGHAGRAMGVEPESA